MSAKRDFTVAVVVATYNWTEALRLTLASLACQSVAPDRIIVADDGSTESTKAVVDEFARSCSVPVEHVWHEDKGFRLAAIRNKAVAAAREDYIIQIDGDVICPAHFVEDHLSVARRGCQVNGGRAMLDSRITEHLLQGTLKKLHWWSCGVGNRMNALRIPLLTPLLSGIHASRTRGCNMAFWRADFIRINGYNEAMTGWGYEDNEMTRRMCNCGVSQRAMKMRGAVYHIFHKPSSRAAAEQNRQIWQQTVDSCAKRCDDGIDKYVTENE